MKSPSTKWREHVAADEAARFEDYAQRLATLQELRSRRHGPGRALHRKQLLAMRAEFEVLGELPEYAVHGLFAKPGKYPAVIRLSNGSLDVQPDSKGDIRGYALRVEGLSGPGALGTDDVDAQCFLLINHEAFSSAKSAEFVGLVEAAARGGAALLKHLVRTHGLVGAIGKLRKTAAAFGKPFGGFATETFFSAAPIACGPFAGRVRLLPARDQQPAPDAKADWGGDIKRRLAQGPFVHDFQIQFFVDEETTPIEDASVVWPESEAPYVTVARLTIPAQQFEGAGAQELQGRAEALVFDPWLALAEHRPLGDVMRARKHVYYASQKARGVG